MRIQVGRGHIDDRGGIRWLAGWEVLWNSKWA